MSFGGRVADPTSVLMDPGPLLCLKVKKTFLEKICEEGHLQYGIITPGECFLARNLDPSDPYLEKLF